MIEADELETALARQPPGVEVILWIDEKAVRIGREISRREGLDDLVGAPKQHAAAFGRRDRPCVRDHRLDHRDTQRVFFDPSPQPLASSPQALGFSL